MGWDSDDGPGFGGSYTDRAGELVAGNTFDYPFIHGQSLIRLGRPFCSMSAEAFCADTTLASKYRSLDLICGAQVTTKSGSGAYPERFEVFPEQLQTALSAWSRRGGDILISGSRIATDVWARVYDFTPDSLKVANTKTFVADVLGYRWASSHGTNTGLMDGMPFYDAPNPERYHVPNPDGIRPAHQGAAVWLRYGSSGVPAAVRYRSAGNKVVSVGVPVECLKRPEDRDRIFRETFEFFR